MRPRLHLHIGAHRTGTSSIQRFLSTNSAALTARGIRPIKGLGRHFALVRRLFSGPAMAEAAVDELLAEALLTGATDLILSDEDLCTHTDLARLAPLADHFDLRILYVLRRQDLWLESWYSQNVKWQWNRELAHLDFAEFLHRRRSFFWIDYAATIDRLERIFGADALRLMIFEKSAMLEGPVAAFARAIGLEDLAGFEAGQKVNASLSPLATEFIRQLPLDEMPERVRRLFETACHKMDREVRARFPGQSPLLMEAATRAAVMEEYAPGNARVAARLGREVLFTDPLPDPDAPLAPHDLPETEALMETFVAPLIRHLSALSLEALQAAEGKKG